MAWKVLTAKKNPSSDDPTIIGFAELEYTPEEMDPPLVQTRGVQQQDKSWKNWPNVVLQVKKAVFKSVCVKKGDKGPYLSIIGWDTPRDGFNELAKHCVDLIYGAGSASVGDDIAGQAEAAISGGKRSPRRDGRNDR